jgi:hypothetical protein
MAWLAEFPIRRISPCALWSEPGSRWIVVRRDAVELVGRVRLAEGVTRRLGASELANYALLIRPTASGAGLPVKKRCDLAVRGPAGKLCYGNAA